VGRIQSEKHPDKTNNHTPTRDIRMRQKTTTKQNHQTHY
jgi:hypothetical protein